RARAGYRGRAREVRRIRRGIYRALGRARRSFRDHDAAFLREAQGTGAPGARPRARCAPHHRREALGAALTDACVMSFLPIGPKARAPLLFWAMRNRTSRL